MTRPLRIPSPIGRFRRVTRRIPTLHTVFIPTQYRKKSAVSAFTAINSQPSTLNLAFLDVRPGIHLPSCDLWLDPHEPRATAFVSHAHSDHIGRHEEVIFTPGTAALMRARLPGKRREHQVPFGQPFAFRSHTLTLLPAGHVAGSAQLHAVEDATGASLLYTGDFKLRPGLSAEPIEWRQADTLIMETTFGKPQFRFPPTAVVIAQMVEFCRDALADGAVPILFGYSLGKSQEILCALVEAGLKPMLHGTVYKMAEIYRELRPDFPATPTYDAEQAAGHVLIFPPSAANSRVVTRFKNRRTAVLTGWAVTPGAAFRYGCDAAFPLSDHADYDDLLRYVELVQPRRVLTIHGSTREFAADLRQRGLEAWALGEENQLEMLALTKRPAARPREFAPVAAPSEPAADSSPDDFRRFAALLFAVAATPARNAKVQLIADYLAALDADALEIAARYLSGRIFPRREERVLQAGWAVTKRALLAASGLSETELRAVGSGQADQSGLTREALRGQTGSGLFTLREAAAEFDALQRARGPIAKSEVLQKIFSRLSADEAAAFVKILSGDARIGLKEGLVEEAVAKGCGADPEAFREAGMLLGDIGAAAALARAGRLQEAELQLFQPVKVMLASPEPTSEAIRARHPEADELWVEDKFDGIRAQLHAGGGRAEIYSRDLRRITAQFPELAEAASRAGVEAVLDGEIIAEQDGRALTFFDLQKRLGRSEPDLFLANDIPVRFVAFDLLAVSGRALLTRPLSERRTQLDRLELPPAFRKAEARRVRSAADLDAEFFAARLRRNEGLIVKDPASAYLPGRRGLAWLKLKRELATLDVVVVGAEWGHGKRHKVISDYTFAVRDDASGALLNIGKAYSGLTDAEIADLTQHFLRTTLETKGKYHVVDPQIVLEIAFDSIQPSNRHASGLAMRFPRIKAIRRDKSVAEIDRLSYARSLVGG